MLLLALVGVPAAAIAADYALSSGPDTPELDAFLSARGTNAGAVIEDLLAQVDIENSLRRGGLDSTSIVALRDRFVES
jgi:hypothetical protein